MLDVINEYPSINAEQYIYKSEIFIIIASGTNVIRIRIIND